MNIIKNEIRLACPVFLTLFTFLLSGCVSNAYIKSQASVVDTILERGEIKVGMTADYKPFSYVDESQEHGVAGLDVDLAVDLAKSLGVELKIVNTSWPTLIADLEAQKYDIAMSGITIRLDRQKVGLFSNPVMSSGKAAITRKADVDKFTSIEAINTKGVRVIVNPGGTNEAFARSNFPDATIVENGENLTVFEKVRDGEADLMVTDAIETIIQEKIYPELVAVNPNDPFNHFELGYLMSRDHTLKAYVDQWLRGLKITGAYQNMFDQAILNVASKKE